MYCMACTVLCTNNSCCYSHAQCRCASQCIRQLGSLPFIPFFHYVFSKHYMYSHALHMYMYKQSCIYQPLSLHCTHLIYFHSYQKVLKCIFMRPQLKNAFLSRWCGLTFFQLVLQNRAELIMLIFEVVMLVAVLTT